MFLKNISLSILLYFFIAILLVFPDFSKAWSLPDWIWNRNKQQNNVSCEEQPNQPHCTTGELGDEDGGVFLPGSAPIYPPPPSPPPLPLPKSKAYSVADPSNSVVGGPSSSSHGGGGGSLSGSHGGGGVRSLLPYESCRAGEYRSISEATLALGKNPGSISCKAKVSGTSSGDPSFSGKKEVFHSSHAYWHVGCKVSCDPTGFHYPSNAEKKSTIICSRIDTHGNFLCSFNKNLNENCSTSCTPLEWDAHAFYFPEEDEEVVHREAEAVCSYAENYDYGTCKYKTNKETENCISHCWPKKKQNTVISTTPEYTSEPIDTPASQGLK